MNRLYEGKWQKIASGYSCRFVLEEGFGGVKRLNCQWKPKVPSGRKLRQLTGSVAYLEAMSTFLNLSRGDRP